MYYPAAVDGSEGVRHTLRSEELARDVEGLAADNDDLLTAQELLSNDGRKTTKEVTLAIDDNLCERKISS